MTDDIETKMVFAVCPEGQGDGAPMILLGVPADAWERLKDGKTSTFDLTKIGVPLKIVVYGAPTQDAAMEMIKGLMSARGVPYLDMRREDFSIKPKRGLE